jgi:hypothetical protein
MTKNSWATAYLIVLIGLIVIGFGPMEKWQSIVHLIAVATATTLILAKTFGAKR